MNLNYYFHERLISHREPFAVEIYAKRNEFILHPFAVRTYCFGRDQENRINGEKIFRRPRRKMEFLSSWIFSQFIVEIRDRNSEPFVCRRRAKKLTSAGEMPREITENSGENVNHAFPDEMCMRKKGKSSNEQSDGKKYKSMEMFAFSFL